MFQSENKLSGAAVKGNDQFNPGTFQINMASSGPDQSEGAPGAPYSGAARPETQRERYVRGTISKAHP